MSDGFDWKLYVTPGLGDNTYVVESGDELLLVDPQRDVWRFLPDNNSSQKIRYVLETHVHNDYVSGAIEIQNQTGAEIVASAAGNYEFPHLGVREGDDVRIGALRFVVLETPGHTPEHISWLVYQDEITDPVAVFTGGSLLVGSAGRTDLLGEDMSRPLTQQQFRSLQRFAKLPPYIQILPTHGAGSFCAGRGSNKDRVSTLDQELQRNAFLKMKDEQSFLEEMLQSKPYPAYYRFIAPINRKGPRKLGTLPLLRTSSATDIAAHLQEGGWVIDCRNRKAFAKAHVPGSLNIELQDQFATYAGWMIPFGSPLMLIVEPPLQENASEAVTHLIRIGYEDIRGYLEDGFETWERSGGSVRSYPIGTVQDLCNERQFEHLIDVRQKEEWDEVHVRDSMHVFIGDLPARIDTLSKDNWYWIACASGFRSAIAASYLDRFGIPVRLLADQGIAEVVDSCPPISDNS